MPKPPLPESEIMWECLRSLEVTNSRLSKTGSRKEGEVKEKTDWPEYIAWQRWKFSRQFVIFIRKSDILTVKNFQNW